MDRVLWAAKDMLLSLVFLIPLFLLYAKFAFHSVKIAALYLIFAMYLVAMGTLVGLPSVLYIRPDLGYNLIPFAGFVDSPAEALLNVLLFVPLGGFLPLLCQKYRRVKNALGVGLLITLGIELLQILTFRTTDVNDILANVAGTLVGYGIVRAATRGFAKMGVADKSAKNFRLVLVTVFAVVFALLPLAKRLLGADA